MYKKFVSALSAVTAALLLSISSGAEESNALLNYADLNWQGDKLFLDKESKALYFGQENDKTEEQEATLTIDIEQGSTGFLFYVDIGNGAKRGDSGYCLIRFLDEKGTEIFGKSTGLITDSENYVRYSVGENEKFYPLPDGAKTVQIVLRASKNSSGDRVNAYFRNFSLFFSDNIPLCQQDNEPLMKSSTSLSKVEIGLTPYTRWIWVGFIFLVAMAFYLIRVWRQKYAVTKLNKK